MKPDALLDQTVNPEALFTPGRIAGALGWVLCDALGQSLGYWKRFMESSGNLEFLGEIRGLKLHQRSAYAALEPLRAQLSDSPGPRKGSPIAHLSVDQVTDAEESERQRHVQESQRLLRARQGKLPAVVLIRDPEFLDAPSVELLMRLSQSGDLKLFILVPVPSSLPPKWRKLHESGSLISCPVGRFSALEAPVVISEAVGYPVPLIGAVALHGATCGQAGQADLILENVPSNLMRQVLLTGQTGRLPLIKKLTVLLRARHAELSAQGKVLLGLCALRGHLPLREAYRLLGRGEVDPLLGSDLVRRERCSGEQIICAASPLLAAHWRENLSSFEMVEIENTAMDLETCCDIGLPQAVATFLPGLFVQNTQQLIAALNIANDNQISDAGEAVATGLRQSLPGITGRLRRREAALALARYSYVVQGPHAALRELNRAAATDSGIWLDEATSRLLVAICLESGRLLPTIQRVARLRGLAVAQHRDDPLLLDLLSTDGLTGNMRAGLEAARRGNMRRAVAHLASGLRKCSSAEAGINVRALRSTFLSATGICLALGGYVSGWHTLMTHLTEAPEAWHARSIPALELASGLRQLQLGKLLTGEQTIAKAALIAELTDAESVYRSAVEVDVALNRMEEYPEGRLSKKLAEKSKSFITDGRNSLEHLVVASLMRDPVAQSHVLEYSAQFDDPRAHAFGLGAGAQLGNLDPIAVIDELLQCGQGFHAAWVADGTILASVLENSSTAGALLLDPNVTAEPMAFVQALLSTLGSSPVPWLGPELISRIHKFEEESLPVLPFLAHERRARTLSPRESEIAALAQQGMNNREIGMELTLSVRTVEGHIASVLFKTNLDQREDLLGTDFTSKVSPSRSS